MGDGKAVLECPDLARSSPTRTLVWRLLDDPQLPAHLARLGPEQWRALVQRVGLEDSAELLALASPAQLLGLVDEALWEPETGGEDVLDVHRFVTLLAVLAEAGASELAQRLAVLSDEFLLHALSEVVTVLPGFPSLLRPGPSFWKNSCGAKLAPRPGCHPTDRSARPCSGS